ncbi:hypothetical protein BKH41_02435 [Helicobacter sp. 12S02232-10]|uniref:glycosyltransferase n=1 Tax=Helicobacter sp. 12S02232-10 TaxID=1476197 RepID=UPI000BA7E0AB|nr:glycosyltransferase [Helicobacter sp. 12S02232-10]PAF49540.1 hypothetical protein BKH41_02435 [Helicobacter sp. 12S02232-10]
MKRKIAILCDFDVMKRPRPFRLVQMLQEKYEIFCIAKECATIKGVKCFSFPASKTSKERTKEENEAILNHCRNKNFDALIDTSNRKIITEILANLPDLDLIVVEDIPLLPFATRYVHRHSNTKILVDLREYYPLEYQNDALWMETFGVFFAHLCEEYLPKVDYAISVNERIAKKYQEVFGISCEAFYSLPPFYPLLPSKTSHKIQIIYHGFLSFDRNSENLLEIAKRLDPKFCLNIMGLSNQKGFLESLQTEAKKLPNVNFLPPVAMEDIIPFCNRFDIGIITLPPNGFNNINALPNKFFEYIQSRLCVVSYPSPEIKALISDKGIGKSALDFDPQSIASVLNAMDKKSIWNYKLASSQSALELSLQTNKPKIIRIIESVLGI